MCSWGRKNHPESHPFKFLAINLYATVEVPSSLYPLSLVTMCSYGITLFFPWPPFLFVFFLHLPHQHPLMVCNPKKTINEGKTEKNNGTQQTKMGGELVFKTKRTFKTRVTKNFLCTDCITKLFIN